MNYAKAQSDSPWIKPVPVKLITEIVKFKVNENIKKHQMKELMKVKKKEIRWR